MPRAVPPEGPKALRKAPKRCGPERTRSSHSSLVLGQVGRKTGLAQQLPSTRAQRADKELLGSVMLDVEVPGSPGKPGGSTDGFKPAGLVASTAEAGLIDEALNHKHRVAVVLEPVVAQALERQAEHSGSQVGKLLAVGKDQESGVVDHQAQATGALAGSPTNPLVAGLDVEGGAGEEQKGDGLAVQFGQVAQSRTDD